MDNCSPQLYNIPGVKLTTVVYSYITYRGKMVNCSLQYITHCGKMDNCSLQLYNIQG